MIKNEVQKSSKFCRFSGWILKSMFSTMPLMFVYSLCIDPEIYWLFYEAILLFWHSNQNILIYCILQQFIEFGVRPGTVPPPFFYKKVSNPSNGAKYHLRSYSMRYLAKTNTFLWNNMIPALGATIQKNFWFYSKGQRKALAFSYQFNTI